MFVARKFILSFLSQWKICFSDKFPCPLSLSHLFASSFLQSCFLKGKEREMFFLRRKRIPRFTGSNRLVHGSGVDLPICVSSSPCKSGSSPFDGRKKKKQPNKRRDRLHKETATSFYLPIHVSNSPCKSGSSPFDARKKTKQPNKRRDRVHKEAATSFCLEKKVAPSFCLIQWLCAFKASC
ncbi:hypothetical protein CEXT_457831 [Caerostris extrusa]|uniref:Uncharacterized protein n=1 Tax=Caerostris extrusa TaxID=172846 RepID=A0AAV4P3P5_CAEEX|nr:hypothetical protein CEXT_457831 [Caerostris extrusa]